MHNATVMFHMCMLGDTEAAFASNVDFPNGSKPLKSYSKVLSKIAEEIA